MKKNTVHDYVVVLKNHNKKTIEITGWLLSVLAIIIFLVNIYESPTDWGIFSSLFILIGLVASNIVDKRKKKIISFTTILLCAGIGLNIFTATAYVGSLLILAGIIEKYISKNKEIGFSKAGIVMSGLFPQKYSWSDLNNVIIKDDLLTMDFKNNKVLQRYTDDEEDEEYEVESDEFNEYCLGRLREVEGVEGFKK
jgi:uncharacterized membrane protein YobD (UPF0266 family)